MKPERQRVVVCLTPDGLEQLEKLGELFDLSKAAVIRQALARWYRSEPLVTKQQNVVRRGRRHLPAGATRAR
jgi:hypothetical protein